MQTQSKLGQSNKITVNFKPTDFRILLEILSSYSDECGYQSEINTRNNVARSILFRDAREADRLYWMLSVKEETQ